LKSNKIVTCRHQTVSIRL